MYTFDFRCTYHLLPDDIEQHICYQQQFLQAFGISEYDGEKIEQVTNELYEELINNDSFNSFMRAFFEKAKNNSLLFGNSKADYFCLLFSYEYFHLFHNEYINYKTGKSYDFRKIIN